MVSCTGRKTTQRAAAALFGEAESSYHSGSIQQAQLLAESGYRRFLSSDRESAGRFRILQIQMMLVQGLYEPARAQLESTPAEVFPTCELAARKHMLEASAYLKLGRYSESEASMAQAERQCTAPGPILLADLATRRGVFRTDASLAEADYRVALKIAREQHDSYREAGALVNLSNASQRQEHYDESIDWGGASLQISQQKGYRLYEEMAKGNLAWNYDKLGDRDRALGLIREAEQLAGDLGAGGEEIRWQNNLGLVHEQNGQLDVAAADYRQALAMARQQNDQNQTAIALLELALVSIETGDWAQAERLNQEGMEIGRREHTVELQGEFAEGLIAAHKGDLSAAEHLFAGVARNPDNDRQSLRWEAQAALAGLYARRRRWHAAEAEYQVTLDTVRQARCSIQHEDLRLPFFANATRVYDSYIDFLVTRGKIAQALKTADESRALTLAEGMKVEKRECLASEAVFAPQRAARQSNATILFYWLGADHSYLWAVSPSRIQLFPLPSKGEIEPRVRAYGRALLGARDVLDGNSDGDVLYRTLVAPASKCFHRDGRVILITDGTLSGLNFETLVAPLPRPHYWIEDVTVENASSLRLLAASPRRSRDANQRLLLIGNPVPPAGAEFGALPQAAREMQSVRKYFSPADEQILEQSDSTAGAYLASHPERFAYVHFVAHGTASLTDPLDSAVVLSPSKPDGAYKLYARDIITRPMRAELVTVSTCKGAGVRTYTGEGLVGLSWAFLHAGAHNVIAALWDVSDESTPLLMDAMYGEIVKRRRPDVALREAKLMLLHSDTAFRKPYYWAPFQIYTGS